MKRPGGRNLKKINESSPFSKEEIRATNSRPCWHGKIRSCGGESSMHPTSKPQSSLLILQPKHLKIVEIATPTSPSKSKINDCFMIGFISILGIVAQYFNLLDKVGKINEGDA
ncbi:hypothetical protein IEQ34_011135 [Dendrobium chrysotoxum]|uniref:Uncharacterized protein n=1 Tax=Dendrobium chrysotoxum TaxID=161865 RepID=A0AAV7GY55_DENCH|nr:hypothetical protein IEQ34_011135 [Dendrobium chrysotoxum]